MTATLDCPQCGDPVSPYVLDWYRLAEPFIHRGSFGTYALAGPITHACPPCADAIDAGRAGDLARRSLDPGAPAMAEAEVVEMAAGLIGRLTKIPRPSTEE